ncbi:MAG: hypothetical protein V1749_08865 [Candidatus Desantisbacteria bacterium]
MFRETPDINQIEVNNTDNYLLPKDSNYSKKHRLPKIGEDVNLKILEDLFKHDRHAKSVIGIGKQIWIRTSGNYWYNAFDKKPYLSSEIKQIKVKENYADFIILLMNSSLFYFWMRFYSDGRHMNTDILEEIPIPSESLISKYSSLLYKMRIDFMNSLFSVFDSHHNRFLTSNIKDRIDLIDIVLGKVYNLSYPKILHIIDFDHEIRGGFKLPMPFITLVDRILAITKDDDYLQNETKQSKVKELEHQIDRLVYNLYGLTEEEIAIVEESVK